MAKLTTAEAAKLFEEASAAARQAEADKTRAKAVLLEWFRKNHPRGGTYRGRISFALSARRVLDTEKVRAELGDRIDEFERVTTIESLSLLK